MSKSLYRRTRVREIKENIPMKQTIFTLLICLLSAFMLYPEPSYAQETDGVTITIKVYDRLGQVVAQYSGLPSNFATSEAARHFPNLANDINRFVEAAKFTSASKATGNTVKNDNSELGRFRLGSGNYTWVGSSGGGLNCNVVSPIRKPEGCP
jgi:hypothetical protein